MKTSKKVLAVLLVLVTLFSVMTIAASAKTVNPPISFDFYNSTFTIRNLIPELTEKFADWFTGVGAFLFAVAIEPLYLFISHFFEITID